jgi:hypothetical protein
MTGTKISLSGFETLWTGPNMQGTFMDKGSSNKSRKRLSARDRISRPSLEIRISQRVKELEDQAWRMPPGHERDMLLRRARQTETASRINEWLTSPGLRSPTK